MPVSSGDERISILHHMSPAELMGSCYRDVSEI